MWVVLGPTVMCLEVLAFLLIDPMRGITLGRSHWLAAAGQDLKMQLSLSDLEVPLREDRQG